MNLVKHIFSFIKNIDKKTFEDAKPLITEANRKALITFAGLSSCMLVVLIVLTFFDKDLEVNRIPYLILFTTFVIITIINKLVTSENSKVVEVSVVIFAVVAYAFGIMLNIFGDLTQMAVTFIVFLFVVPLLFTEQPSKMNIIIIMAVIACLILDHHYKDSLTFSRDCVNIISYGILSIFIGSYLMQVKVKNYSLEVINERLVGMDNLTGIYNRYSFDKDLKEIGSTISNRNITLIALDVNRLKYVNDHFGHAAGDELLIGAGKCIESAYSDIGKCYRIGGDEYAVIIENCSLSEDELKKMLAAYTDNWTGALVSELTISVGIVNSLLDQVESIDELINKADKKMYINKNNFYKEASYERRRS